MENHHFKWDNSPFLWPCSMAFCMFTRGSTPWRDLDGFLLSEDGQKHDWNIETINEFMGLYWDTHIISTIYIYNILHWYHMPISYDSFPFISQLRYKNTARTWHDQAGGRLFPCSNAPQADLQLSWRHKIRVKRSSRTNNFISWLFSGLCWGLGDGKSVLSTCKKGVHEKIKFVQVL